MIIDHSKPLEEKNCIERHTRQNKFSLTSCLLEKERKIKNLELQVAALQEAVAFFAKWWDETQKPNIILPDNLNEDGSTKLIL
jgi:hypothetical protein